jgi:hypothetical protein
MNVNGDAIRQPIQSAGHSAECVFGLIAHNELPDGIENFSTIPHPIVPRARECTLCDSNLHVRVTNYVGLGQNVQRRRAILVLFGPGFMIGVKALNFEGKIAGERRE